MPGNGRNEGRKGKQKGKMRTVAEWPGSGRKMAGRLLRGRSPFEGGTRRRYNDGKFAKTSRESAMSDGR